MPELSKTKRSYKTATGEHLHYVERVSVTTNGEFRIRLPEEPDFKDIYHTAEKMLRSLDRRESKVSLHDAKTYSYIQAPTLSECHVFLGSLFSTHFSAVTTWETVIVYRFDDWMHYIIDDAGGVAFTAYDAGLDGDNKQDSWEWASSVNGGLFGHSSKPYRIALGVEVYVKQTVDRSGIKKIKYHNPSHVTDEQRGFPFNHFGNDTYAEKLGHAIKMCVTTDSFSDLDRGDRGEKDPIKELPYTEESAKFFYDVLMGMCKLHHRMMSVFGNPETVKLAIANNSQPLLAAPKAE